MVVAVEQIIEVEAGVVVQPLTILDDLHHNIKMVRVVEATAIAQLTMVVGLRTAIVEMILLIAVVTMMRRKMVVVLVMIMTTVALVVIVIVVVRMERKKIMMMHRVCM